MIRRTAAINSAEPPSCSPSCLGPLQARSLLGTACSATECALDVPRLDEVLPFGMTFVRRFSYSDGPAFSHELERVLGDLGIEIRRESASRESPISRSK
jgi:hypothetical protein